MVTQAIKEWVSGWVKNFVESWFLRKVGDQTFTGTLIVDDTIQSGSATALRIEDDGGNLGIVVADGGKVTIGPNNYGTRTAPVQPYLLVEATDAAIPTLGVWQDTADANGPIIQLGKSRGTVGGSNTVVQSGDALGHIVWYGADGVGTTTASAAAVIRVEVDGTPGNNDMPSRMIFGVSPDGAASAAEVMRINSAGNVGIGMTPVTPLNIYRSTVEAAFISYGDGQAASVNAFSYRNSASGPYFQGAFHRGSYASPAVVQNGDDLLNIVGYGYSAAAGSILAAAKIIFEVDGTPDSGGDTSDMPGRITFWTTPDGSSSSAERMRINSAGNVGIGTSSPSTKLDVNGTITTTGITFGNETLSAYDEGTWSPTITGSSSNPTVTYSERTGIYTRIGRCYFFSANIGIDTYSGGSGDVRISMPTTASGASYLAVVGTSGVNIPGTPVSIFGQIDGANMIIGSVADNGSASTVQCSDLAAGDVIYVSGHFFV